MIISADSISIDDLRLAYSQIMNNHIAEQSSSPVQSPSQAAAAIPETSPLVARVPEGVMPNRRKSVDVGSRAKDASASDLRQSVSARDVPLGAEAAQDRAFCQSGQGSKLARAFSCRLTSGVHSVY